MLNLTAEVHNEFTTNNSRGESIATPVIAGSIACRQQQMTATERSLQGQQGVDATHWTYAVPSDVPVLSHTTELWITKDSTVTKHRVESVDNFQELGHHLRMATRELIDDGE